MRKFTAIAILLIYVCIPITGCKADQARDSGASSPLVARVSNGEPSECENPAFRGPEKARCNFRKENCYEGMNSESLICRRGIGQLVHKVSPAEIVEINGFVAHVGKALYVLEDNVAANSPRVLVLSNSCDFKPVATMCSLPDGTKVTVIGAFFTDPRTPHGAGGELGEKRGNILALDFFEGGRPVPGPIE